MGGKIGELLLILLIVFVFFGAGKLPKVMEQFGRGLRSFKKGMDGEEADAEVAQHNSKNSKLIK